MDPDTVRRLDLPSFGDGGHSSSGGKDDSMGKSTSAAVPKEGNKDESPAETQFSLSKALPVVPAKLVRKILKGEYVDMAELLKDNMEVERRRLGGDASAAPFPSRASRREVPDLLSWVQCFSLYAGVVTSRYPEKIKELLAYQATIVAEARRCGGRGWLLYDTAFRQNITSLEETDFSHLEQSIYATTFLAYSTGKTKSCPDCMMSDHSREECALHPNRAWPVVQMREPDKEGARRKRGRVGPCYAWNEGKCTYSQCRYEHVCSRCYGEHKKFRCRLTSRDREQGKEASAEGAGR